jgi:hypothetical protein
MENVFLQELIVAHIYSEEIPRLLCNRMVHYRVHNSPSLVPILSHMNPAHTFTPYFPKIHSNIILPSTFRSSEWSLPFNSNQPKYCMHFSSNPNACYIPRLSHRTWFDHRNDILIRLQFVKVPIMLHYPVCLYRLKYLKDSRAYKFFPDILCCLHESGIVLFLYHRLSQTSKIITKYCTL